MVFIALIRLYSMAAVATDVSMDILS